MPPQAAPAVPHEDSSAPPCNTGCSPGAALSLSLEAYAELHGLLTKEKAAVQPMSLLERSLYKASDLKQACATLVSMTPPSLRTTQRLHMLPPANSCKHLQVLLLHGLHAGSRTKQDVLEKMIGLPLFAPAFDAASALPDAEVTYNAYEKPCMLLVSPYSCLSVCFP